MCVRARGSRTREGTTNELASTAAAPFNCPQFVITSMFDVVRYWGEVGVGVRWQRATAVMLCICDSVCVCVVCA